MLPHDRHPMVGDDEECREVTLLADAPDERAQRAVDQPITLENRGMERVFEVRDTVDTRKDDKQESPRLGGGIEPGACDRPIERGIGPEVMRGGAERGATERQTVSAATKSTSQRRADRDAFGNQVEQRWSRRDVAVQ